MYLLSAKSQSSSSYETYCVSYKTDHRKRMARIRQKPTPHRKGPENTNTGYLLTHKNHHLNANRKIVISYASDPKIFD